MSEGAHDADSAGAGAVDFGPLRIRVPSGARLLAPSGTAEPARAVQLEVPSGRVSLSVLSASLSRPLWPEIAEAIATSQGNDGAQVFSEQGEWGREVQATANGEMSRFIGMDGPRWLLLGEASGPVEGSTELAATLREVIRGSVVSREDDALPARTALPLGPPERVADPVVSGPAAAPPPVPVPVPTPVPVRRPPTAPRHDATASWRPEYHGAAQPIREPVAAAAAEPPAAPDPAMGPWPGPARDPALVPAMEPSASTGGPRWWRIARWGVPAGLSAGMAGAVLLLGGSSVLVIGVDARQGTPPPAATLPPTTALTKPGAAPPAGAPDIPTLAPHAPAPIVTGRAAPGAEDEASGRRGSGWRAGGPLWPTGGDPDHHQDRTARARHHTPRHDEPTTAQRDHPADEHSADEHSADRHQSGADESGTDESSEDEQAGDAPSRQDDDRSPSRRVPRTSGSGLLGELYRTLLDVG